MAGFAALAEKLSSLQRVPAAVPERVVEEFNDLIIQEFVNEQDPYGVAWEPLHLKTIASKGHDLILYRHGRMLNETRARASGLSIGFVGTEYGPYHQRTHQNKWGRMNPARPVIPTGSALPDVWQAAIGKQFRVVLGESMAR